MTVRNSFTAEWAGDGAYSKPFSEWTEGMLEGRWAELDGEIEAGTWAGETLASAVRERAAIYREILSCRLGGLDDDEREGGDLDLPDDDDDPVMVPFECPKQGGACYETACLHWNECRYESLRTA